MDRQSWACRRASGAKPFSDPEQQPPNQHYPLEDNSIPWMRTNAGGLLIPRSQKAARSEWNKRMKKVKERGQTNEAMTKSNGSTKDFRNLEGSCLSRVWASSERDIVTPRRLVWAANEERKCRGFVKRRFSHSNSLQGLLESTLVKTTYLLQQKAYVTVLQLNSNVVELEELFYAIKITTEPVGPPNDGQISGRSGVIPRRDSLY